MEVLSSLCSRLELVTTATADESSPRQDWIEHPLPFTPWQVWTLLALVTLDAKGHVVTVHMGSRKGSPRFSDAALKHVTAFTELRELILDHSDISDDGLKQIEGLSKLNVLQLNGTQIAMKKLRFRLCRFRMRHNVPTGRENIALNQGRTKAWSVETFRGC